MWLGSIKSNVTRIKATTSPTSTTDLDPDTSLYHVPYVTSLCHVPIPRPYITSRNIIPYITYPIGISAISRPLHQIHHITSRISRPLYHVPCITLKPAAKWSNGTREYGHACHLYFARDLSATRKVGLVGLRKSDKSTGWQSVRQSDDWKEGTLSVACGVSSK